MEEGYPSRPARRKMPEVTGPSPGNEGGSHGRMEGAAVLEPPRPAGDDHPSLLPSERPGVPCLPGRRGVREDVSINPDDRVPPRHLKHRGNEGHPADLHHMAPGDRRLPRCQRPGTEEGYRRDPSDHGLAARAPWSPLAWARWAAIAGRTSARSFFSSAFSVVGIRSPSRASSTAWWYPTSRSM